MRHTALKRRSLLIVRCPVCHLLATLYLDVVQGAASSHADAALPNRITNVLDVLAYYIAKGKEKITHAEEPPYTYCKAELERGSVEDA
eukprot:1161739-Pelagomonas_calceolata.AAC.7